MGKIVFLFSFLSVFCSFASADPAASVVKLQSAATSISATVRTGSGILVSLNGQRWILTSDHVVYHSNKNFKHTITLPSGITIPAQFIAADAGKGFAVLEPLEEIAPNNFTDISPRPSSSSNEITVIGYPAESSEPLTSFGTFSDSSPTPSSLFPELTSMLEIRGAYAEFGMSGGGAFAEDKLVGVLSHITPGGAGLNVLVVSLTDILTTLQSFDAFSKVFKGIRLTQDPAQQLSQFPSFRTGPLYLTLADPFGPSGAKGIEVILSKNISTETLYAPSYLSEAVQFLKDHTDVRLRTLGFRYKDQWAQAGGSTIFAVNVRLLEDPKLEPLWTVEGYDKTNEIEKINALAKEVGKKLQGIQEASALRTNFTRIEDTTDCKKESSEMSKSICYKAGPWRVIKPKDFQRLMQEPAIQKELQYLSKNYPSTNTAQYLSEIAKIFSYLTL